MDAKEVIAPDDRLGRDPHEASDRRARIADAAVAPDDKDDVGCVLNERAKPLFDSSLLLLGSSPLGDVLEGDRKPLRGRIGWTLERSTRTWPARVEAPR